MTNMIYVTAAYSNALFKAVMPQVDAFIDKAGLPIPTPVPPAMIEQFKPPLFKNDLVVGVVLTNRATFVFDSGIINYYTGSRDFNLSKQFGHWAEMQGTVKMTTNEVYALATNTIHRLGYKLEAVTHGWPVKIDGPLGWDDGEHFFPFFTVEWREPVNGFGRTAICVDADRKEVAGIYLDPQKIRRPDPEIGVEPETWAQHREELEQRLKAAATNMTIELTPGAKRRIRERLPGGDTEPPPASLPPKPAAKPSDP